MTAPPLELILAQQANDAMARGADPKSASDRLGKMIQHLRDHPDLAEQGRDAIARGADPTAVSGKVWELANAPQPNAFQRGWAATKNAIAHPIDTAESVATGLVKPAYTAMKYAVEQQNQNDISSVGGPDNAVERTVTPKDAAIASAQTLGNVALPSLAAGLTGRLAAAGLPRALAALGGTMAAGSAGGAINTPNDPAGGAWAGLMLAPATEIGARTGGAALRGARNVATSVLDASGARPATTQAVTVAGRPVLQIQSAADRAATLNAKQIASSPSANGLPATSDKPVTPMDVAGTSGVRAVRALKTSSPSAESVVRTALDNRAQGAVDRVIQQGLETTGLASRQNGLSVVDDMIAQRGQHGNENYQPVFKAHPEPIDDPAFQQIANTPAGQQAIKRGATIAANRGEQIGSISGGATYDLSKLAPAQRGLYDHLLQLNGGNVEKTVAGMASLGEQVPANAAQPRIAPTLQQAHYIKLGFDDLLNSAPEPGSGGSGPHNAAAIRGLKAKWLAAMDQAAPDYQKARQTYADESELVNAAEQGRKLFSTDPSLAAKMYQDLPASAQDVFRRTGFDALADRIENGPSDVERGVSKPRDQKRMQLLFPDAASFATFKQGLAQEAGMYANEQMALGGSPTTDKMADLANMAGVTLPDIARAAATGRVHRLMGQVAANLVRGVTTPAADALAAERAKLYVAGANGDLGARQAAMARMGAANTPALSDAVRAALALAARGGQLGISTTAGSASDARRRLLAAGGGQ
jgi:hypothetical protein